ncbi:MAG: PilN domain-containing protein [Sedimentisphaerales bacterium]|nr:PilN domain-containing protein [Sedimentisphaerales bacterium]
MNSETKRYSKAISVLKSADNAGWILTLIEKTSAGLQLGGYVTVSDAAKLSSEIEKLSGSKFNPDEDTTLVCVGADTTQTVFFAFKAPLVEGAKLTAIIHAQAETLLPMALSQAAFTWRMVKQGSDTQDGCLAVVRKNYYQELYNLIPGRVESILPDAAGLVKGWASVFESTTEKCALIQIRKHSCILAVSEAEKLVRAAAVDVEDLSLTTVVAHDLTTVLATMELPKSTPVYVTGEEEFAAGLCRELAQEGRPVQRWKLSDNKISALGIRDKLTEIRNRPETIGLAVAALDEQGPAYDFIRLPRTEEIENAVVDKKGLIRSLAVAAVFVVLLLGGIYWTSARQLESIEQALAAEYHGTTGQAILARQQMRDRISKARPDMLEMLSTIGSCMDKDMLLDSISFKKGQPVRIAAKARSFEQVNAFHKKLQEQTCFKDVKLISPTLDERRSRVQFTITLAYRNFNR